MFVYCSIVCLSMFVLPRQITKVEKIVFGYAESQHNMTCNLRGRMNAECDIRCSHLKDEWWTYTILLLSQRYFHKMECWQILQTGYPNRIQGLILLSCYFILYLIINCIIRHTITQAYFLSPHKNIGIIWKADVVRLIIPWV